jgi:hypothetical protein
MCQNGTENSQWQAKKKRIKVSKTFSAMFFKEPDLKTCEKV